MEVEALVGAVPAGWTYTTLADACRAGGGGIQTGPFGSQLHASDYVEAGVPSIMPQNIGDNRVVEAGISRIALEDARKLARYRVRPGDIVYSRRGDVERRALIREEQDGWLCGTGCLRVRLGKDGVDPHYASYYLAHPNVREWITRHAHGATMPNLNTSILGACPVVVPPPDDQHRIAHVLGALDDKIELNRRMNETLAAMARALFKSWFVDFDPVRAKAEGQGPGLPAHLVKLFPDRLVESGLGLIPEGWRAGCFGDFLTQRTQRVGAREVVVLSAMATGVLARSDDHFNKRVYSKDTSKYLLVEEGDFAFNPSRINIGSIGTLQESIVGGVSPVYIVARPGRDYRRFLEFALLLPSTKAWITSLSSGSVRQSLNFADFASIPFAVPPSLVAREFASQWEVLRLRIDRAEVGSLVLSQLRDLLLPALITGRLRVFDHDRRTVRSDR